MKQLLKEQSDGLCKRINSMIKRQKVTSKVQLEIDELRETLKDVINVSRDQWEMASDAGTPQKIVYGCGSDALYRGRGKCSGSDREI